MAQMRSDRRLPDERRGQFKERFGRRLGEDELAGIQDENKPVITVGDVVSLTMRKHGIAPLLSVYDGMTERREMTGFARLVEDEGWEEMVVRNPAGEITGELFVAVENALTGRTGIIRVDGEEDLAVIPCMILAPEGCLIVYGWPGEGMMAVATDAASRRRAEELYQLMEESE